MISKTVALLIVFFVCGVHLSKFQNEDDEIPCESGWRCVDVANCSHKIESSGTIFPCSVNRGYKICCPPSSITTKTPNNAITSTSKPVTKPNLSNKWASIPRNLRNKVKLLPLRCGNVNVTIADRIINGMDTQLGQYPWMVLLGYQVNNFTSFGCGGTLISKRYVLTAAHCRRIKEYLPAIVRLGEWNISEEEDCETIDDVQRCNRPLDVNIEEFIVHENYGNKDLPSYQNDIALIRLAKDVNFNEFMSPVCLSPTVIDDTLSAYTISGWGVSEFSSNKQTPVLQYAEASLFDIDECNSIAPAELKPLAKSQFCAVGDDAENACQGDSGGPLVYFSSAELKYYQKGIVSVATTPECGTEGKPSIYTEVSFYIKWILRNLK